MSRKLITLFTALVLFSLIVAPLNTAGAQESTPFGRRVPIHHTPQKLAPNKNLAASLNPSAINGINLISDPSFEASYTSGTYWGQYSTNSGSPLCNLVDCTDAGNGGGVTGPRTGSIWSWFGGYDFTEPGIVSPEIGDLYQSVTIPACAATLQFYLWIGVADPGSDVNDNFIAAIDGNQVFSTNATQKNLYPAYTLVSVDVSAYGNGGTHVLEFFSQISDQMVSFNLDDVSLTVTCPTISGNAGVAGATMSYTGGTTTSDGSGNYSIEVARGWSGTVTPSKAGYSFSPTSRTYTNVTTNQTSQNYIATELKSISGTVGVGGATLNYTDGTPKKVISQSDGNYLISVPSSWSGTITPTSTCFTFNPVNRTYSNVITNQTNQNYTPSFNAAAGCADINVLIGGANQGRFGIAPHGSTRASFAANNGPVKIMASNAISLISAERVIYKVNNTPTSFTEMMGLPDSQLTNTYWLPWYNNVDLDTQLRFGNVSGNTATIHIFIGGMEVAGSPFTLNTGQSTRASFAGVNSGPVQIVSDRNIVAAERLIYKVNGVATSFAEMMALPDSQLNTTYWLPWYNNTDLDTQLRIGNVSANPATIHIFIGGTEVTPVSGISLNAGASTRLSYANVNNGPVKIQSNQSIVAAERVIYKVNGVNTSFSEMMGLPDTQLNATFWLPWYNNVDLDTQLRFGVP